MSAPVPIRRALISVSDKSDLVPLARALRQLGVEIVSTGGTAAALAEAGIEVIGVDRVTGFPEMMDGRVKTLHPAIHGALLARRDVPEHVSAMREHRMTPIDLVCVNLYPFERTILRPGVTRDEANEQIDIGGPAMIRSAAKNHQFVTVVTSPEQYDRLINELTASEGATTLEFRRDLAAAAFSHTAGYDAAIASYMLSRREEPFPELLRLNYTRRSELRYGENPHQQAALYVNPASPEPSVVSADLLHGKALSYNNVADAAAALELVKELDEGFPEGAAAAIVKHANPCGAAVGPDLTEVVAMAYRSDSLAAYGGILACSRPIDETTAKYICEGQKFLEVILAPIVDDRSAFEASALRLLAERWSNVRLLAVHGLRHAGHRKIDYKSIPGGMLVQERDMKLADPRQWSHVAGPELDSNALLDARFAWTVVKHMKSNAIAICRWGRLLGGGVGSVDRVTSCRIAIEKSGDQIRDPGWKDHVAIAASDAFFPFPDGPKLLIDAGVKCIVQPGGSIRDQETIDLCQARNVTCLLTGVRHFRH